jgi:hypothetical protein
MEFSFSRHRDHNWKIPAQNGPNYWEHVTMLALSALWELKLEVVGEPRTQTGKSSACLAMELVATTP